MLREGLVASLSVSRRLAAPLSVSGELGYLEPRGMLYDYAPTGRWVQRGGGDSLQVWGYDGPAGLVACPIAAGVRLAPAEWGVRPYVFVRGMLWFVRTSSPARAVWSLRPGEAVEAGLRIAPPVGAATSPLPPDVALDLGAGYLRSQPFVMPDGGRAHIGGFTLRAAFSVGLGAETRLR